MKVPDYSFELYVATMVVVAFLFWGKPDIADAIGANLAHVTVQEWMKMRGDLP